MKGDAAGPLINEFGEVFSSWKHDFGGLKLSLIQTQRVKPRRCQIRKGTISTRGNSGKLNLCMSVINSEHNKAIVYCSWNSRASLITQSHELLMKLGSNRLLKITGANHNGIVVFWINYWYTQIFWPWFVKKWKTH